MTSCTSTTASSSTTASAIIDVANDVAFLAMDLDHHERPDLARFFVRRVGGVVGRSRNDGADGFLPMLPRLCPRQGGEPAITSRKARMTTERRAAAERARRYFQLALRYAVVRLSPLALVVMGRVASGKSTLGRGARTGARLADRISSDELRKTLAGAPLHERGDAESRRALYAPAMSERDLRHVDPRERGKRSTPATESSSTPRFQNADSVDRLARRARRRAS